MTRDSTARPCSDPAPAPAAGAPACPGLVERKRAEFARLARRYELQCLVATMGRIGALRRQVAGLAVSGVAGPVLELCCGTGGVTAELARLFDDVRGVDLSPDMLARAARRVRRGRLANVRLHEAEVSTLRYPAESFSAVVISLGLHELPLPIRDHVLAQAAAWLRPGGRFVLCDYVKPRNPLVAAVFRWGGRVWIEDRHFDEYIDYPMHLHLARHGFKPVAHQRRFLSCLEVSAWTVEPGTGRASRAAPAGPRRVAAAPAAASTALAPTIYLAPESGAAATERPPRVE